MTVLIRSIFAISLLIVLIINGRLYYEPDIVFQDDGAINHDLISQLTYLRNSFESGGADRMQDLFPEGAFFSYVLLGLAWTEVGTAAKADSDIYRLAVKNSTWALSQYTEHPSRVIFSRVASPPSGAFYSGWGNYLRAKLVQLQSRTQIDSTLVNELLINCEALAAAFNRRETPFIESYPGAAWPADALPGILSLKIHDLCFQPKYQETVASWITRVRSRLDRHTKLIPHAVDPNAGAMQEAPRGSSQALMIRLLAELDPGFAKLQYLRFRDAFVTGFLGLPAVREYPKGTAGSGDIDSGPVIFDIGSAATVVALGTFNAVGDVQLSKALDQTTEAFGFPISWGEEKYFLFGQLEIGDAFLAWSRSTNLYVSDNNGVPQRDLGYWRIGIHVISLVTILLVSAPTLIPIVRRLRAKN